MQVRRNFGVIASIMSASDSLGALYVMSDSDSGSAGSVAHAPKARKGQDGQVAKLRDRFEHPMSQALTVVPTRRSARVASAGQLHKSGKRCRSSAQPSSGEAPAASPAADPSAQPPTGLPADPSAGPPTGLPADTLADLAARIGTLEQNQADSQQLRSDLLHTQTELAATRTELLKAQSDLTAACSDLAGFKGSVNKRLGEQTSHSIARTTAVKAGLRQQVNAEGSSLEHLSQRIRAHNIVLHGVPDIAAHSRPADLTRYVSNKLDTATPRRGSPSQALSQSIWAVSHIGRPGSGKRAVLVEFSTHTAKHEAFKLSPHLVATAQGHAVLAGDFNARVGSLPDPWVADMGDSIPPQLQNTDSTVNTHGRKLMRLCADSAMILCTGRTLADTPAQPTFKARTNTVASRLDHVLVDPGLFSFIQYCGVGLTRPDSDHMPLEMRILLSAAALPSSPLQPVQHHTPTWLWDGAKLEQYALALQAGPCQASLQQSCEAAAAGELQQADGHFITALKTAAQMAGLRQTRPQSSQPPRLSDFPWFDSRCVVLRSQLRRAKLLSPRSPEVRILKRRYRGQLRRSKAAGNQQDILSLSQLLKSNPRQFWRKASLPHNMLPPELQTPSAWDGYLANLTAPPVHIADQLPLPHTPQPPAPATSLDQPLTHAEIEVALQKLHNGRSGALLGYTSELLRYAKLTATDEDPAPEHLLVPCLQLLFNTAFSTGSVPQSWKTSLVTPIFKKGDATDTANYKPIAVGEPLSRLYASILVQRLVHFTEQHDLRSPTQAGYRPEHSTIHQAFVLQHSLTSTDASRLPCTSVLWI